MSFCSQSNEQNRSNSKQSDDKVKFPILLIPLLVLTGKIRKKITTGEYPKSVRWS